MDPMTILAIDPGLSGAYVVMDDDTTVVDIGDLPTVAKDIDGAALARMIRNYAPRLAIVERVASMPKQGVASTFRFGLSTGVVHGVIQALDVPLMLVTPQLWKKYFRLGPDKEKARLLAVQRFPDCAALTRKKDHGRAEALLIALWHIEAQRGETP
jgi:crossover junction endodeoxyribonuclease RuvC